MQSTQNQASFSHTPLSTRKNARSDSMTLAVGGRGKKKQELSFTG